MLRPFKKNSNIKGDNLEYNHKAYKVKKFNLHGYFLR